MTAASLKANRALLIGEILLSETNLSRDTLSRALKKQTSGDQDARIGELLIKMDAISENELASALAIQHESFYTEKLPPVDQAPTHLLKDIPISFAKQHKIVPYAETDKGRVLVALPDPLMVDVLDDVSVLIGKPVEAVLAAPSVIVEFINKAYGNLRQGADLGDSEEEAEEFGEDEELVDILDLADEAPIIRWVNSILFQAVKERASDIHIEPGEKEVSVRYRVDGALRQAKHAHRQYLPSILARVKIMAGLNIAEKRLPQDGRIRRKIGGKEVDMRVATIPTATGERVTIRLLDRSSVLLGLADIGMDSEILVTIRDIIKRPHGIMLVTGPTGSGKTTTLYACLSEINAPDTNILTVEDPVEYQLEGISQTQVNPKIDFTFASGLRSFLRHDPDVIMVGEIRDVETAEIAIQASLTGHFVLSTVHTNDASGAVTRLIEMGIEPFLVASSMVGLMAQRLVRRPCKECATPVRPEPNILVELGLDPETFYRGGYPVPEVKGSRELPTGTVLSPVGCSACNTIGYSGRTGIYEMLVIDDPIRALTLQKADAGAIRKNAMERGMITLRQDGARKVIAGMTTPEEVLMMTAEGEGL